MYKWELIVTTANNIILFYQVSIECWPNIDRDTGRVQIVMAIEGIDPHSTTDALSAHNPSWLQGNVFTWLLKVGMILVFQCPPRGVQSCPFRFCSKLIQCPILVCKWDVNGMRWGQMEWDGMVRMRWNEMRRDEMRWDEMRWDEMRWDEMR